MAEQQQKMNQTLLKRLFKSIPVESAPDLSKIAQEIILDARKKGHSNLAEALSLILTKKNQTKNNITPATSVEPKDRVLHQISEYFPK